ncbi:MAG: translation elongation factor Ts [Bacteroidaceae bacterium]|jgi:elongation factor Ts|nr:translation elongation factor Ts [Bacteroidaceae bacterium]
MAVTIADITKLRKMTGAGMMDCKKALAEANNDIEAAIEIIRAKGQAVAAKRSDREAAEGCVLCKAENGFGAILALKCETDFVANNADFIKLAQSILDLAVINKSKTLDEVKALMLNGFSVEQAVTDRSGITGEKMELDGYMTIEGENISCYNHQAKNTLCTMVALSENVPAEYGHGVAMQIAAMNPVSICEKDVPEDIREREFEIAKEKTREEGKPENMIERIAEGRMNKFYKESCLLNQDYIMDTTKTVATYLKEANKACTVLAFKRFTLRSE